VLEVDDRLAVDWTRPQEYPYKAKNTKQGLGSLRAGYFFVVWGKGTVGAVPARLPDRQFRAMLSADAGEPFSSFSVSLPIEESLIDQISQTVRPDSARRSPAGVLSSPTGTMGPAKLSSGLAVPSVAESRLANGSPVAGGSLAAQYQEAEAAAIRLRRPGEALLWYYASAIVQPASAQWHQQYRWLPGLHRPCVTVHFGVGIRARGHKTRTSQIHFDSRGPGSGWASLAKRTAPIGESLLAMIDQHALELKPDRWSVTAADANRNGRAKRSSLVTRERMLPVTYLGQGSRSQLTQRAIRQACDVLVWFELSTAEAGHPRWFSYELFDLGRRKSLLKSPRIPSREGPARSGGAASGGPSYFDTPTQQACWELQDLLEDKLSFQPLPAEIQTKHAVSRISNLARRQTINPLAALAEMCVYRNLGFVDNRQLLAGFRSLLGSAEDGETLMLGSERGKRRILRRWLPFEDPRHQEGLIAASRSQDEEDD